MSDRVHAWIDAVIDRHTRPFSSAEFLRAVRALSARYVEGRHELSRRTPIDSDGKRAAFAGFYAPLHLLTVREVIRALGVDRADIGSLADLGCGTGVASAAWATAAGSPITITGVDRLGWTLQEAAWNWQALGLSGRTRRGDMTRALPGRDRLFSRGPVTRGVILAWSLNELDDADRRRMQHDVMQTVRDGSSVLIVEPLARSAVPWWDEWADAVVGAGGRADEWKFDLALPPRLAALDEAAGFRRTATGARTLWLAGAASAGSAL